MIEAREAIGVRHVEGVETELASTILNAELAHEAKAPGFAKEA